MTHDLTFKRRWQLLKQSFLILDWMKVFVVIFDKIPDSHFQLLRHGYFSGVIFKSHQLLFQYGTLIVHASQYRW